jgi:hypothetical protein
MGRADYIGVEAQRCAIIKAGELGSECQVSAGGVRVDIGDYGGFADPPRPPCRLVRD